MTYLTHKGRGGFIALMSVIIIGAMVTVMTFTLGTTSFLARFDLLARENKVVSMELVEGCVAAAALKLRQDAAYQPALGGECVSLGGTCGGGDPQKVCKICQVIENGSARTIRARALYNGSYTNLSVTDTLDANSFTVSDWSELPTYTGASCSLP